MAKGKVCLVLIETKKIRGEKVLAGTVLMEGVLARAFSPEDFLKASPLGRIRTKTMKANGGKTYDA